MKILILTEFVSKANYGGKEKFNRNLIEFLLKNNHEVVEYCLNLKTNDNFMKTSYDDNKNYKLVLFPQKLSNNLNWKMNKIDKVINKFCDDNAFDIIIGNFHDNLRKTKLRSNFIYVMHNSPASLIGWNNENIFYRLKVITKYFLGYTNQFKGLNHIVFSDDFQKEDLIKRGKKYKNIKYKHVVPLPNFEQSRNIHDLKLENRKNVVWVGRIYNRQKNIKFLNKLSSELEKYNIKLHVYGAGQDEKYLNSKNIIMNGWLNDKDKFIELTKYKCFVMTSNNEGASFVLNEAMNIGIPIVGRKTFPTISYLTNNDDRFLVDKKDKPAIMAQKIAKIVNDTNDLEYRNMVENILKFYEEKLSIKNFEQGWKSILDFFEKQ